MSIVTMHVNTYTVNQSGTAVKLFYNSMSTDVLQFAQVTRDTSLTGNNATGTVEIFSPTDYSAAVHVSATEFTHLLNDLAMTGGVTQISITYNSTTLAVSLFTDTFQPDPVHAVLRIAAALRSVEEPIRLLLDPALDVESMATALGATTNPGDTSALQPRTNGKNETHPPV